jgi:hypothetical protein
LFEHANKNRGQLAAIEHELGDLKAGLAAVAPRLGEMTAQMKAIEQDVAARATLSGVLEVTNAIVRIEAVVDGIDKSQETTVARLGEMTAQLKEVVHDVAEHATLTSVQEVAAGLAVTSATITSLERGAEAAASRLGELTAEGKALSQKIDGTAQALSQRIDSVTQAVGIAHEHANDAHALIQVETEERVALAQIVEGETVARADLEKQIAEETRALGRRIQSTVSALPRGLHIDGEGDLIAVDGEGNTSRIGHVRGAPGAHVLNVACDAAGLTFEISDGRRIALALPREPGKDARAVEEVVDQERARIARSLHSGGIAASKLPGLLKVGRAKVRRWLEAA